MSASIYTVDISDSGFLASVKVFWSGGLSNEVGELGDKELPIHQLLLQFYLGFYPQ